MRDETNPKPGTKKRRTYQKEKQRQLNCHQARAERIKKQHDITLGRFSRTYKRGSRLHVMAKRVLDETRAAHLDNNVEYKEALEKAMSRALKRATNEQDHVVIDEMLQHLRTANFKVHNEMRLARPTKGSLLRAA